MTDYPLKLGVLTSTSKSISVVGNGYQDSVE